MEELRGKGATVTREWMYHNASIKYGVLKIEIAIDVESIEV